MSLDNLNTIVSKNKKSLTFIAISGVAGALIAAGGTVAAGEAVATGGVATAGGTAAAGGAATTGGVATAGGTVAAGGATIGWVVGGVLLGTLITLTIINSKFPHLREKILNKPTKKKESSSKYFSLLLITTSNKLKTNNIKDKNYNKTVQSETIKSLINESRYFLIENEDIDTLKDAKTSVELPDIDEDNLFILKIKGQGNADIGKYQTKSWMRDSITSKTCQIENVLHLLDASIAEKFVRTV